MARCGSGRCGIGVTAIFALCGGPGLARDDIDRGISGGERVVYVGSNDGRLYAFDAATGALK